MPRGLLSIRDDRHHDPVRHDRRPQPGEVLVVQDGRVLPRGLREDRPYLGAELREVEYINEEWCFGVYAGEKGLFPAQYARVLDA